MRTVGGDGRAPESCGVGEGEAVGDCEYVVSTSLKCLQIRTSKVGLAVIVESLDCQKVGERWG